MILRNSVVVVETFGPCVDPPQRISGHPVPLVVLGTLHLSVTGDVY